MSEQQQIRKVNGRDVTPASDLVIVEKLDWSKLDSEINEYVHGRIPERKDEEFYFDRSFKGLIAINPSVCLLITDECVGIEPEIFDYKQGIVGFKVGVFVKDKDPRVINTMAEFDFSLTANQLPIIQTGEKLRLPDFMGSRYKYNSRIAENEQKIIKFLMECDYKHFEKLNKQKK